MSDTWERQGEMSDTPNTRRASPSVIATTHPSPWTHTHRPPRMRPSHTAGGPAVIRYRPDGTVQREYYYLNGEQHRVEGPAVTYYREGTVAYESYYLHGEKVESL